jgi:hypothetical protein
VEDEYAMPQKKMYRPQAVQTLKFYRKVEEVEKV